MKASNIVNITLKNCNKKRLSKGVKKYLKMMEKEINQKLIEEHVQEKVVESIALGLPLFITNEGKIEVVR